MEPSGNRVVVPARQATLAGEIDYLVSIPRLLKSLDIPSPAHKATWAGGLNFLEAIPFLLKSLKIRALYYELILNAKRGTMAF